MDNVVTACLNAGGMGAMGIAILLLHRDAIKEFRKELRLERNLFRQALRAVGVALDADPEEEDKKE